MVAPSLFAEMSPADQERFHRLSDFVEELNRMLFQIEELLSEIQLQTAMFATLNARYQKPCARNPRNGKRIAKYVTGLWFILIARPTLFSDRCVGLLRYDR